METIKTKDIQTMIEEVQNFKGEYADEYKTRLDYVMKGGFERDYFANWLDNCSDYPMTQEIIDMATHIHEMVCEWGDAVDEGWIDPKEDWEYETFEERKAAAEAIIAERQYIVDAEKARRMK